jgi:hypothetical protein
MYFKKILVVMLLLICAYVLYGYCLDLLSYYHALFAVPVAIGVEVGPVKITLDNATEWSTVFKMLVTALGTYAGTKVINKYIK